MKIHRDPVIWWFSLPIAALILLVSLVSLFTPGFYAAETVNWQAQSEGQDIADLVFIVPALLLSAFFAYRGKPGTSGLWLGTLLYLAYTFSIYCFSLHFNRLFIPYCFILGLSVFGLIWGIIKPVSELPSNLQTRRGLRKLIAIYFMVLALLFYVLWMSELLPATWYNRPPAILEETGLASNPVHVLDLALFLPAIFITGLLLLRGKQFAGFLVPVWLGFFILMDCSLAMLNMVMVKRGLAGDYSLAAGMILLALFSGWLLWRTLRATSQQAYPVNRKAGKNTAGFET